MSIYAAGLAMTLSAIGTFISVVPQLLRTLVSLAISWLLSRPLVAVLVAVFAPPTPLLLIGLGEYMAGVCVLMVHPGWMRTTMGGSDAPMLAGEAAFKVKSTIENATAADNGRYLNTDGENMPW